MSSSRLLLVQMEYGLYVILRIKLNTIIYDGTFKCHSECLDQSDIRNDWKLISIIFDSRF